MSNASKLDAVVRESFGKGVARKLRAAGQTPVVVYGHGIDPLHLTVETHPLSLIVRHKNALVELSFEGGKQLALVKDVQKDPVRQIIEHVDFVVVSKGETVEVEVPVHVEGEPFAGTTALQETNTILVSAPATDIPEAFSVSVEGAEEGTQILAGDVELPKGVELVGDAEALIVQVAIPVVETESTIDELNETEEASDEESAEESAEDSEESAE
ncbi:50S ribosomal protein L25/general stress protein Ctc [Canibacter zhoujuaniae]|uniref:50S ribosomal protein L25/general stress protein Ctc n=1 Tax=Canibacter zhoujuaniae TaxID=2708343 RepID=UPI00141D98E0|nr:50S ribosomal protein L25/general stress protein Ctc [Canibacter zhoujuaniae]